MKRPHAEAGKVDTEHGGSALPSEESATLVTLDTLAQQLGKPSPEVDEELFEDVPKSALIAMGKRADSSVLIKGAAAFVESVRAIWAESAEAQRDSLVGYSDEFLPVLVSKSLALRALYGRFTAQGPGAAIELSRRRQAAQTAFTTGRAMRDQAARVLRRVLRGDNDSLAAMEKSVGTAEDAASLSAGLNFLAGEVEGHLRDGSAVRKRLMARIRMTPAYVGRLKAAATKVNETDESAAAVARDAVSQDTLDEADGRVMHLVDWIYRAFKEGSEVHDGVGVPELGALSPYFVTRRAEKKPREGGGGGGGGGGSPPV